MNREFIVKMMKAKKMEYEAIKELLPEELKPKVSNLEESATQIIKEFAMSFVFEDDVPTESKKAKKVNVE